MTRSFTPIDRHKHLSPLFFFSFFSVIDTVLVSFVSQQRQRNPSYNERKKVTNYHLIKSGRRCSLERSISIVWPKRVNMILCSFPRDVSVSILFVLSFSSIFSAEVGRLCSCVSSFSHQSRRRHQVMLSEYNTHTKAKNQLTRTDWVWWILYDSFSYCRFVDGCAQPCGSDWLPSAVNWFLIFEHSGLMLFFGSLWIWRVYVFITISGRIFFVYFFKWFLSLILSLIQLSRAQWIPQN